MSTLPRSLALPPMLLSSIIVSSALAKEPAVESARPESQRASYVLQVDLDPNAHSLHGVANILLAHSAEEVTFRLHRSARVSDLQVHGGRLRSYKKAEPDSAEQRFDTYTVWISSPSPRPQLAIEWKGTYYQDPSEGEAPGEIHNHTINATVGTEGVYLTGAWYPFLNDGKVADYEISLNRPDGLTLVSSGEKDQAASDRTSRDVWYSAYPLTDLVVVGGNHAVYTDEWRGLQIAIHLKPSQEAHAAGLKASIRRYLDRYEPLLGPLPTQQYRVVDNFFSSGFAFPGFTLLSSSVIELGEVSQTHHGYIDHEFVHTWFGVGVHADDRQGNWSEALTSYATNYYGYVLDEDAAGARKYRRDSVNHFNKLSPEQDVPLADFGRVPGTSRYIGYNKGALVFQTLEQEIGRDAFFAALRNFNYRQVGRLATWDDLQESFEQASGADLGWFFEQWVRQPGAFESRIASAKWIAPAGQVAVTLDKPANFRAKIPFSVRNGNHTREVVADVAPGDREVVLDGIDGAPDSVALDPDFHILRRLSPEELLPTVDTTRRSPRIVALVDGGEESITASFIELFGQGSSSGQFRQGVDVAKPDLRTVTDLANVSSDWSSSSVLIIGAAVHSPAAQAILNQVDAPARFTANGFSVKDKEYTDPTQAISATFRHPKVPGSGVTVVYANSADAYPRATSLPFFPNSIIVFQNKRSLLKEDLELIVEVPVGR